MDDVVEVGLVGERERVAAHAALLVRRIGIGRHPILEVAFEVDDQHPLVLPMFSHLSRQSSARRRMLLLIHSMRRQMREVLKPVSCCPGNAIHGSPLPSTSSKPRTRTSKRSWNRSHVAPIDGKSSTSPFSSKPGPAFVMPSSVVTPAG